MTDPKKRNELIARYERAMHGMQAGVALDETLDPKNMTPKHLRVGVNSALVDGAALAKCLIDKGIDKGIITEEEYLTALAEAAEREHASYEQKHSRGGMKVTLV